jgi:methylmalonyl-CoA mutase N-terminal domain/subunit
VLAYEHAAGDVVDPLGGSYYVESMTNRIEAEAQEYIDTIDKLGGALTALERGFQQREIQEAAYRFQREIEDKERVIVGVNDFLVEAEQPEGLLRIDPSIGRRQAEKLQKLRAERDTAKVDHLLGKLAEASRGKDNLLPYIIECVDNRVTLGEVSHALRAEWGEHRETVVV